MNTYFGHVLSGAISRDEAAVMQAAREVGRSNAVAAIGTAGPTAEAAAFGMLDAVAVVLVKWFGGPEAARILRHYADVCGRRGEPAKP